jgi:predicted TPR repeat methyltransferase
MTKNKSHSWTPENWREVWDQNAERTDDFGATGRGGMSVIGFLHTMASAASSLQLTSEDHLLDIGCGTGLFALSFSPFVKTIHGVDISKKMIERAQQNCSEVANVSFSVGSLNNLVMTPKDTNKVLLFSVLQYLSNIKEVFQTLDTISNILPPGGRGLLASNPNPECAEIFWERTLEGRDKKTQNLITARKNQTLWADPNELINYAKTLGLSAYAQPVTQRIWQSCYMFDLILEKP